MILFLGLLLTAGCSKEKFVQGEDDTGNGTTTLSLTFSTSRSGGEYSEGALSSLRVIIFRSNSSGVTGPLVLNKKILPASPNAEVIEVSEIVPAGYLNIYLVGNESDDMGLAGITNPSALNAIMVDYANNYVADGFMNAPFPMYSSYRAVLVNTSQVVSHPEAIVSGGTTTFEIERAVAKLTVQLDCNFSDLNNLAITLDSARVVSMPLNPRLLTREYGGLNAADYFSSDGMPLAGKLQMKAGNSGFQTIAGDPDKAIVFYMPEHILNRTDHHNFTYLELKGHMTGRPSAELIYRIPLGNGLGIGVNTPSFLRENFGSVHPSDLTITRNMHYDLKISIKSLGEMDEIEVDAVVKPWVEVDVDGSMNAPYLNVSTVSTAVNGISTVQRVYFWTNQRNPVMVEETGKVGTTAGANFTVDNIFTSLSGGMAATNFHFNSATGTGYFDVTINPNNSPFGPTRFLIYLRVGSLRREIEINANYSFDFVPGAIWLSPTPGNASRTIQVTSTEPWVLVAQPPNAVVSPTSGGAGVTNITVSLPTGHEPIIYAGLYTFELRQPVSGLTSTVTVDRYHIYDDELLIPNNLLTGNTIAYTLDVEGASCDWVLVPGETSTWFTVTKEPNGDIRFTADQSPNQEVRTGFVTVAHADDPAYKMTFLVEQDIFSDIPPFRFFVIKFTWINNDVDIAFEFTNHNHPYPIIPFAYAPYIPGSAHKALGWGMNRMINLNGTANASTPTQTHVADQTTLAMWGGDATGGQGETVFFKAPLITPESRRTDTSGLPRHIEMNIYAGWFTSSRAGSPVKLSIYTYEGGVMMQPSSNNSNPTPPGHQGIFTTNFYNVIEGTTPVMLTGPDAWDHINLPASIVHRDMIVPEVASSVRRGDYRNITPTTGYTHLATITYDRYRRSARIEWRAQEYTGPIILPFSNDVPSLSLQGFDMTAEEKPAY